MVGLSWQVKDWMRERPSEVSIRTCADLDIDPSVLPVCMIEKIESLDLDRLPALLKHISPQSFDIIAKRKGYSKDWISLVLFPYIEAAVMRKCRDRPSHPYCDTQKRQRIHRHIDNHLGNLLQSKNEIHQYHGLMLACARNEAGRSYRFNRMTTKKMRGYALFLDFCVPEKRVHSAEWWQQREEKEMMFLSLLKYSHSNPDPIVPNRPTEDPLLESFWTAISHSRQE